MRAGFGAYVHWPYCARICPYCDFNVYRQRETDPAPLLAAIKADIAGHANRLAPRPLDSVFLGGGTPSLLSGAQVADLLGALEAAFGFHPEIEITLEANPEDQARFADLVAAGVNRVSLGVQALNDADLKALGRAHDAASARRAIQIAADTGARVSVDLIYARAGQTLDTWGQELKAALALPVEHWSFYQLTIEAGTAFERAVRRGQLRPPAPPLAADLYALTQAVCAMFDLEAYEISNHARGAAARSRHNLVYWRGGDWLGLGPGAHGRIRLDAVRTAATAARRPQEYIDAVAATGVGWAQTERLTPEMAGEEALLMGLRLQEGIPRAPIEALLGRALNTMPFIADGLLAPDADTLRLTNYGRLFADRIVLELLS